MRHPLGTESEPPALLSPQYLAQSGLLLLAALFLLRGGWLALGDALPPEQSHQVVPASHEIAAPAAAHRSISATDFALLSTLCPTGAAELPPSLRPTEAKTLATTTQPVASPAPPATSPPPSARITGIRVASRPVGPNDRARNYRIAADPSAPALRDGWLVDPQAWYGENGPSDPPREALPKEPPVQVPDPESQPVEPEPVAPEPSKPAPVEPVEQPLEQPNQAAEVAEEEVGLSVSPPAALGHVVENPAVTVPEPTMSEATAPEVTASEVPVSSPRPAVVEEPAPVTPSEPTRSELIRSEPPRSEPTPPSLPTVLPTPPTKFAPGGPPAVTEPPRQPVHARIPPDVAPVPEPMVRAAAPLFASPHKPNPAAAAAAREAAGGKSALESHRELFAKNCYPSARDCAECHQQTYDEWSVSSHAYAYVSPMFHRFEQTITDLSNGTVGHFCTRCHTPVAVAMREDRSVPLGELAEAERDGIGCIACHRVNERYGKTNGERRVVPGPLEDPVYGTLGGEGVAQVMADPKSYKVKRSASEKGPGQVMHNEGRFFDQLTRAEACTSCHQVAVEPQVKLEVVWEQYRASPACKKGITCQECHMGRVPGVAGGYHYGPIAEVGGKTVHNHRKQHNHTFYGPGYSIAHPGIFPQHKKANRWSLDEWLAFDWRAGWGTDAFEDQVESAEAQGVDTSRWFPPVWVEIDDRCDAREIIEENQEKLQRKRQLREVVMENGSKVDGPFFRREPRVGHDLRFDYVVANLNEGHNLPTASLGAQPQLWANVVLIGPDGRRLWETGYTDSQGDLCDIHSEEVRQGRAPYDAQLFNLQTMFLITGATGTDREFFLPVNLDIDQVAQLRPGTVPVSVLNHPPFIRMESRSLAPLGKKRVKYRVPGELLCQPGRYRLSFRLRSRVEPMYFMRFCGATDEMMRAMTEGTLDIHPMSVEFDVR